MPSAIETNTVSCGDPKQSIYDGIRSKQNTTWEWSVVSGTWWILNRIDLLDIRRWSTFQTPKFQKPKQSKHPVLCVPYNENMKTNFYRKVCKGISFLLWKKEQKTYMKIPIMDILWPRAKYEKLLIPKSKNMNKNCMKRISEYPRSVNFMITMNSIQPFLN